MAISFNEVGSFTGVAGEAGVVNNPTSLQFGPDGRLYVSEQNGDVNAFTVTIEDGKYIATDHELLTLSNGLGVAKGIQNHNDDGSLSGQSNRQVTGIAVAGTAENPIVYITSSDPRISSNGEVNLDTNSGVLTQATWNGTEWETVDLIRGLPRSEENHANNGMVLSDDGETMYLAVGGNTNNGAPSSFFSYTGEYALSGSVLEIDLADLASRPVLVDADAGQGGTPRSYVYDLPTLDDPSVPNDGVREDANGMDVNGPFGGNDGFNMAILPADAPLRIYADGLRNPYDLAFGPNGQLYTVDNGSNGNLGGNPVVVDGEASHETNNGGSGDPEPLFLIEDGGYYGHPNPARSNQDLEWTVYNDSGNPDGSVTPNTVPDLSALVPDGVDIQEGFIIDPSKFTGDPARLLESGIRAERSSNETNALATVGSSSNGLIFYDSNGAAFDGALDGSLLVTQFNDNITVLNLTDDGTAVEAVVDPGDDGILGTADDFVPSGAGDGTFQLPGFQGLTNPLDVTVAPDGTIWVAEIGSNDISVWAPSDQVLPDDPDFDNDGILNANDPFTRDATNGTSVAIEGGQSYLWSFAASGTGNDFPGPDGYGGGLTGVMINGTTDFEEFFQEPSDAPDQDVNLDNVKFNTAAAGGATVIENVSNGDPFQGGNSGEFLFHTGMTIAPSVETFTVKWTMLNPGDAITGTFQQIGGYIGTGDQSNYLKVVAIKNGTNTAGMQITLEDGDTVLETYTINANDLFDVTEAAATPLVIELLVDVAAQTATPTLTYETVGGAPAVVAGTPISLAGTGVLDAIQGNTSVQGQETGLAVGLMATNNGEPEANTFQAVFDDIEITTTEAELAPIAGDDIAATGVNQTLVIPVADLLANDTDGNVGDVLSITSVTAGSGGTVALDDNGTAGDTSDDTVVFTPDTDFQGTADFTYEVEDETGLTDTGEVTVGVADEVVIYRVNAGGDEIIANDGGPNWTADTGAANSPFLTNPGSNNTNGFGVTPGATVEPGTPASIFLTERWDSAAAPSMQWGFDVDPGIYEVRLFVGNGFAGTNDPGERVYDVSVEGQVPANMDDIDLSGQFGHTVGGMLTTQVTVTDGQLNLEFLHEVENPLINGIEIVRIASADVDPTVSIISGDQTVSEDGGQVQISLATDITVPSDETVDITIEIVPGTATPGEDYEYTENSAVFDPGTGIYTDTISIAGSSSDVTALIDILQDGLDEGDEAFTVNIVSVSDNAQIGTASAEVTIADDDGTVAPGEVLFRINSGGAEVAATDGGPNWSADTGANPTPFLVAGGENVFGTNTAITVDPADVNNAPAAIFDTERWDTLNADAMQYEFGGLAQGQYTINLYLVEGSSGQSAPGQRSFDVAVEGVVPSVFDDITPFDTNGNAAFVLSHTTAITDGTLDLDFLHGDINNPAIRAIEIVAVGDGTPVDTVDGVAAPDGDFSSDAANPDAVLLPEGGSTTIVSNLEGGHNDRDFITVTIPEGFRLADVILDGYSADPGNSAFLGLKLGSDFVVDPAIPALGTSPDGVVDIGDLEGGYVFNDGDVGTDLLAALNDTSSGFAGFDEDALTGDITFWLNQGGDASQATITFVTEEILDNGTIVAAINAGGPALTQDGIDFAADVGFLNGTPFADGNSGNGQQPIFDGTIYETERFGGAPGTDPLQYEIAVGDGDYEIDLYFAEIFQPNGAGDGIGARVFDVTVEGQLVLDDFDILAQTGGDFNQPITFTVPGSVSPDDFGNLNALDIDFSASADNAKISGIVVRDVTEPEPTGGAATLTINDGADNIEVSNFGNGSFTINNTGTKNISFIEIDVTDALLPDAVFDPLGEAGDLTAKILTLLGGSDGGTGLVIPPGGFGAGAVGITYLGEGGVKGFEKIRLEFTDFNPGDSISFGVDMDPNSIAGAAKGTLDSGADIAGAGGGTWDVGGISGAELSGSTFSVGYDDGTTSAGQLMGQGTGQQTGATALSSQDSPNLGVSLTVNGLGEGAEGTYSDGGPQILIQGEAGETARVLVSKGFIVPFTNEFPDTNGDAVDVDNVYHDRLDAQIAALEASGFPANNMVEMLYVDIVLDGTVQDISGLFDFTQVADWDLSVPDADNEFGVLDEAQLPLGIVAGVVDPATDEPKGPITSPVHLTYAENAAPTVDPVADITIDEGQDAGFAVAAADADGDPITLSVEVTRDIDGTVVDPAEYTFTDNGDGTGSFLWTTDEPDDGAYTVTVTADDGTDQTTTTASIIVNEVADPQPEVVLFRVNAGGEEVAAADGGPAWSADTQANNSPFLTDPGSNADFPTSGQPNTSVDISDLAGTGAVVEMIGIERWDNNNPANGVMTWAFPVEAGVEVTVRLYVAELFTGLPDLDGSGDPTGDRIFDVSVDGIVPPAFEDIDPYTLAGNSFLKGAVVEHTFVSDGTIDLQFLHQSENPAIKGIEIVTQAAPEADAPTASLTADDVTAADSAYTFTVTYTDATAVDVSTLDDLDVSVSNGAIAFDTTATLVAVDVPADGGVRTATYQITPPGGAWDETDNGTYTVTLNDGEVADILGNANTETVLGSFAVDVQPTDQVEGGRLEISITPGTDLAASTFGQGSFILTNASDPGVQIQSVTFDLSTGILPDMVFDPTGAGGDATASPFTPNAGAAATGLVVPADPASDPFSQARNGGFDKLTIDFTDFDPNETFTFTTDIDPNSIQGVPGAGAAGAVSGYELIGSTVTVTFTDGTNTEVSLGSLFDESAFGVPGGSLGGSQAAITTEDTAEAPVLTVLNAAGDLVSTLPGTQSDLSGEDFTVVVTGPAGATVDILQMDTRLFIASGEPPFDVATNELPFYANEAMAGKVLTSVTLDANGEGQVPLSLLTTAAAGPDGGLNAIVGVVNDGGELGLVSAPLVVKLGVPLVFDEPGIAEFDGSNGSVIELPHDPIYEIPSGTIAFSFVADTVSGNQGLFTKDASGFVGGGNHFAAYLDGDTLTVRFQDGSDSAVLTFDNVAVGEEYEVAMTFGPDGSTLWVNGNAIETDPLVMDWTQNAEFLQWGGRGWASDTGQAGFDAPFDGQIADRQIYSEVLTASEIAQLAATSSISNPNLAPNAVDDTILMDEDGSANIDAAANDSDPDGGTVTVAAVLSGPANGTATIEADGTVTYTPDPDYFGPDSFELQVSDGQGGVATSTVDVTVNPMNDNPIAVDDTDAAVVGSAKVIDVTANDIDVDGDTLSVTAVTQGALGSVTINPDGTVTYTPNGTEGDDSFTYTIDDGQGGALSTATVEITVLGEPNTPPVAVADNIIVDEDGSITFDPAANDTDANGDTVTVDSILSQPANGSAVVEADGTVTYTPDADYNGGDSFEVQVSDGNGGFDSALVTVTVNPLNDAPEAADDAANGASGSPVILNLLGNDTDVDGDTLTIQSIGAAANGTVVDNGNGTVTYTPNDPGFVGQDSFTYTVTDGDLTDTATATVTLEDGVEPIFSQPGDMVFNGSKAAVQEIPHSALFEIEEGTVNFAFTAADTNGAQGLFTKDASGFVGGGNHFALYLQGSQLVARFQDGSASATFTVPGIQAGVEYDVAATFDAGGSKLYLDGVEVGSSPLVMDWTQNVEFIQWGGRGWASASGQPGFDAPFEGTISDKEIYDVALDAGDIANLHSDGPPNTDPVAVDDTISLDEDTSVTFDPTVNDVDADGDTLSVSAIASDPSNGSVTINGDGTVTYTPDADFNGADSFEVTIGDGRGGSDVSTVSVTVDGVEDDPVAVDDQVSVLTGGSVIIDVLANDSDGDGDPLSVASFGAVSNGTLDDNGDGTFTYTPDAGFVGTDEFVYELSDGAGPTDTATVTIDVTEEPTGPQPVFEQPGITTYNGSNAAVDNYAPSDVFEFEEGTVAFSFIDDNPNVRQGLVVKDASGFVGGGNHFAAYVERGDLVVRFQDGSDSAVLTFDDLNANQEYEVAAVFGNDGVELWVDGSLVDQQAGFQSSWLANDEWLQVGGLGWASATGANTFTNPFSGQIADVQIFDGALDEDQIGALADQSSFDLL